MSRGVVYNPDVRNRVWPWLVVTLLASGCAKDDATQSSPGSAPARTQRSGHFSALSYNVAGLPQGLSQSMPERFTPLIGPKLNAYDLVLLQESWLTPEVNPLEPLRVYHEILVATADHPYKTPPAAQPFGTDPSRPSAQLGDGLNVFSRFELGDTTRVAWTTCVESASDCLALKGFSVTPVRLDDGVTVQVYDLHMEAGGTTEDDAARALAVDQLADYIAENSAGEALIVGGDFNLHSTVEPAKSQLAHLLERTGLSDACAERSCDDPGVVDKLLFRSSDQLELQAKSWSLEDEVFVSAEGEPLSDHVPVAVGFDWETSASK